RDAFEPHAGPTTGFTEIVMFSIDNEEALAHSYGAAQQAMFWSYLHDKNPLLGSVMPHWLVDGLSRSLYYASRVRGSEVDFEGDRWARERGREYAKNGNLTPLHTLVTLDTAGFQDLWAKADQQKIRLDVECGLAVSFLVAKEQPIPQLKNFLTQYLSAL